MAQTAAAKLSQAAGQGAGGVFQRELLAGNRAAAEAARTQKQQNAKDAEAVLKVWEIQVSEIGSMEFRAPSDYSEAASVWPEFRQDGSLFVTGQVSRTCRYCLDVFLIAALRRVAINKAARLVNEAEDALAKGAR